MATRMGLQVNIWGGTQGVAARHRSMTHLYAMEDSRAKGRAMGRSFAAGNRSRGFEIV
ncbi:MAG: hypothetical protein MSS85_07705 [Pyramidobacter sp.]|uniref:hypothetical protein n=1 Tax=Pyramidobacter sp. TaxID=1943581 RepID=UPI0025D6A9EC|nr:hypothetical protein [Pyramidobacter sp.]MCI7403955.1 hypothetical protein [Pyramidobacter sp.]